MELYKASEQWASRPDDERFWTLEEMHAACTSYRNRSREKVFNPQDFEMVVSSVGDLRLSRLHGTDVALPSEFTYYSFGQFANLLHVPAGYLRTTLRSNPELVAQNLNYGISQFDSSKEMKALVQVENPQDEANRRMFIRATTSEKYARFWNNEITERLLNTLSGQGWRVPPARPHPGADVKRLRAATEEDLLRSRKYGLSVNLGDMIGPSGLYASDHDCFVFMVNEEKPIDAGNGEILHRGFYVKNSEVGDSSLVLVTFLYEGVCGNHIIWNAHDVKEMRVRHLGDVRQLRNKFTSAARVLETYMRHDGDREEAMIIAARQKILGKTNEEVIDFLFESNFLTRKDAEKAVNTAEEHEGLHGNPLSVWGVVGGVTRMSQATPHADTRETLDRAAAKILDRAL